MIMFNDKASVQVPDDSEQTPAPDAASATSSAPPAPISDFVKFEGNQSKRWDGKEVELKEKNVTNWNVLVLQRIPQKKKRLRD